MGEFLIRGEIQFARQPILPAGTKIYVRLLDTTVADAPARLVAEQLLTDSWQEANAGERCPFALSGVAEGVRSSLTLAVLVDVDGDGKISRGDFINMQSYPVHTYGNPDWVSVTVREVT